MTDNLLMYLQKGSLYIMDADKIAQETEPSFLDELKEFNAEMSAQLDSINTAGDREALAALFEKELAKNTLSFAKRLRDIALFSDSDQASISALKLATGFLFDAKNKDADAFDKLMSDLLEADKVK